MVQLTPPRLVNRCLNFPIFIPQKHISKVQVHRNTNMDSSESSSITCDQTRVEELVNKVTTFNIHQVAQQLLNHNLINNRHMFCESIMESQLKFPESTNVYATLVSIINSEFPDVGRLLVTRVALDFRRSRDQGKKKLLSTSKFIAHLVNQRVVHEQLALDVLLTLLGNPNSDSIEVAVRFCAECGLLLQSCMPRELNEVLKELGVVMRKGVVAKRVQSMIRRLFAIRRAGFKKYSALKIVEVGDQITHHVSLLHDLDPEFSNDEEVSSS